MAKQPPKKEVGRAKAVNKIKEASRPYAISAQTNAQLKHNRAGSPPAKKPAPAAADNTRVKHGKR